MDCLLNLLNSNAVAAFIGAFSAFVLVLATDWRRERRTVGTIKNEVKMNQEHAKGKLEAVKMNRAAVTDYNRVVPAPIIRFSSDVLRALTPSVLHRMSPEHRRALDAMCYMMEATDAVLANATRTAERFRTGLEDGERQIVAEELLSYYDDSIIDLGRLVEMCDFYLSGDYRTLLTKQYQLEDYIPGQRK